MSGSAPSRPELLAPAGGMPQLVAAIAAGADAVYLGVGELNARRSADNFTMESLAEGCRLAHLRGVRIYLTANVMVLPSEMSRALTLVGDAWRAGIDAVIVQDLGLLRLLRDLAPEIEVHASTQMNAHARATVEALVELGVARVTLARETSLQEIADLSAAAHALGAETESFVHGALCVCYSGQCLMSSMVGGRSANRGMCAQPCRLTYDLIDEQGKSLAAVGPHLLSPKDLAGIGVLDDLVRSGIDSLKIEGRMKSAEYVALVTGTYRRALDRAVVSPDDYEVREGEMEVLSEAFSRGFTEAYLVGDRGNDAMSYSRPNNRGVPVGRVTSASGGAATIRLETAVDAGDTIEFWTGRGRFAQTCGALEIEGRRVVSAPAGSSCVVITEQPVMVGDRVFRVRNAQLSDAAGRLAKSELEESMPLQIEVRVVLGEPVSVRVRSASGESAEATGDIVERARSKALTTEEIVEHVGRLGGTPYFAQSWSIDLSPGAGLGFSTLHRVRRAAIEALEAEMLSGYTARKALSVREPALHATRRRSQAPVRLVAAVADLSSAWACLDAGADEAHVPWWALADWDASSKQVVPVLCRARHDREREAGDAVARRAGRAVAADLGSIAQLARAGVDVQAHWGINAANAHTVAALADLGVSRVWLSPELTLEQVMAVAGAASADLGVAVGGRQELMVTEHCVFMSQGPCDERCATCVRRRTDRYLLDRKGYRFPIRTDPTGRTHLYNGVALDGSRALRGLLAGGVSALRVDLESYDANSARSELSRVRQAVLRVQAGEEPERAECTTTGHFFRGVS